MVFLYQPSTLMAHTTASGTCTANGAEYILALGKVCEDGFKQPNWLKPSSVASKEVLVTYDGALGIIDHLQELGGCMSIKICDQSDRNGKRY